MNHYFNVKLIFCLFGIMYCNVGWSQDNASNTDLYSYEISIQGIESPEALKDINYVIHPIFDSNGIYNADKKTISFKTAARIEKEDLISYLSAEILELDYFKSNYKNTKRDKVDHLNKLSISE